MASVSLTLDDAFGARISLKRFSEYCFGFENKWFHERWYDTIQDRDVKSGLIIAPRNSAKSTCWGKVSLIWLLGNNPDLRVLLLGRTSALAKTDMRFIRLNIESNDKVKEVFPYRKINGVVTGLKPSSPWGEDWLTVENNRLDGMPSIYAVGLEGSISGFRADIIIVDDLIDQNNVMTEGQREKVNTFWDSVVVPTLNPGGRIFSVGTRYHAKDFYSRLLNDAMYKDHTFMFPALKLDENGEIVLTPKLGDDMVPLVDEDGVTLMEPISYWPERWPAEDLLKIKERMGSLAFNSQYQCDPSGYAGQLFDPDDLHYYDPTRDLATIWGNLDFVMSVDPNITEDPESDNTAIVTGAVDRKHGTLYILDMYANPLGFVNQVKMLKQYGSKIQVSVGDKKFETEIRISKIGVESVAYQRSLQQSGYLLGLPVVEVKQGNRNKEIRILGIQPHIENGRILFPNPDKVRLPWWEGFYTEYCSFPKGRRDDRLDALEILVSMVSGSFGVSGIPWGPTDDSPRRLMRSMFRGRPAR